MTWRCSFLVFLLSLVGCDESSGDWYDAGRGGGYSDAGSYGYDASGGAGDAGAPDMPQAEPVPDAGPEDAGPMDICARRDTREPVVLYLSADDSNSMASPAMARAWIERGGLPSGLPIRTYEFLNYYNVAYSHPEPGDVTVVPELRTTERPDELVLQIGVQSAPRAPRRRVITLVLDTSGSMSGPPIGLLRDVCRSIAGELRAGDVVSMVEWDTARTVPLEGHVVSGPDDPALLDAIARTMEGGGTNLSAGLRFGYEIATRNYDPSALNRVVLVSDGQANVGVTDEELIAVNAVDAEREGIFLVGVGVGDGYNDTLMDVVTDRGRGAYVFIDSEIEAQRMFGARFDEVMEVALMGVRVELTLPWHMAVREFHGEEISAVASEVQPQHLAPDDAMVFHQEIGTCDVDEMSPDDTIRARATFTRPDDRVAAERTVELTMGEMLEAPDVGLRRGDTIVAWAEALADLSGGVRGPDAIALLDDVIAQCAAADPEGSDAAMLEIARLAGVLRGRY